MEPGALWFSARGGGDGGSSNGRSSRRFLKNKRVSSPSLKLKASGFYHIAPTNPACSSASDPSPPDDPIVSVISKTTAVFGQVPRCWETNTESSQGTEKAVEIGSGAQTGEIERGAAAEKEKNNGIGTAVGVEQEEEEKARKAKQEPVTSSSLIAISRILKGIPQSPHFYQLSNLSEYARDYLMSSWDRIFEETVDRIQTLQADGFWVSAKELWKPMEDSQSVGYNVIPLRKRLVKLTEVMMVLKSAQWDIKRLEIKAENHRLEKSRLEFVILSLQKMIEEEEECSDRAWSQVPEMEKELSKYHDAFAKLAVEPL